MHIYIYIISYIICMKNIDQYSRNSYNFNQTLLSLFANYFCAWMHAKLLWSLPPHGP